jgi:WXG100 family type VII secretion target
MQVAGKFEHNRGLIEAQLNAIRVEVERTRPHWTGRAGVSFQSVSQLWEEQAKRIVRLLGDTAQAVRSSSAIGVAATQEAEQIVNNSYDVGLSTRTGGAS